MNAKGMHIRDQVILIQALADKALTTGPSGPRYVMAREIVFGTSPVELTGRDVIFVADTIKHGGDAPFGRTRAAWPPPRIQIPARPLRAPPANKPERVASRDSGVEDLRPGNIRGCGLNSVAAPVKTKGLTRPTRAIARPDRLRRRWVSRLDRFGHCAADPTGNGAAGSGGDGGPIAVHYCTKTSDGELQGLGGAGGPGGDGGLGGRFSTRSPKRTVRFIRRILTSAANRVPQGPPERPAMRWLRCSPRSRRTASGTRLRTSPAARRRSLGGSIGSSRENTCFVPTGLPVRQRAIWDWPHRNSASSSRSGPEARPGMRKVFSISRRSS